VENVLVGHVFILALLAIALLLFAFEVTRPDVVAIGVMLTLILTGILTVEEGLSGFSSPAVITVIAMFILSSGLVRAGVADFVGARVVQLSGGRPALLTVVLMLTVGMMSAVMNNIGAVAVLLPATFVVAQRSAYPATKLLMPLSFGSLLGGLTTLIGTPPNLLVSISLEQHGFAPFRMFDYLPTGLVLMLVGACYMALIGRHLIPGRNETRSLTKEYQLHNYLTEIVLPARSSLVGRTIEASGLRKRSDITVLRIQRKVGSALVTYEPRPDTVLNPHDRLVVEGKLSDLLDYKERGDVELYAETKFTDETMTGEGVQLAEVAIAPNSNILGRTIRQIDMRRRFGVLVLAMRHRGRTIQQGFDREPLATGDVLLVQGATEALTKLAQHPNFLVVNRLDHAPRQVRKAPIAIAIMSLSIIMAATGLLHISVAALLGVVLMVLTGCVRPQQMYYEVEWRVIFLIAGMMPLGLAMDDQHTGTASWLAQQLVALTGDAGPLVMLACIILFTTMITEVMSNAAAAVLLAPIGIAIAVGMGLQPYPFLMGIAIGASTTFLTPIGHQANVLVYGVGGYRFVDFPRVGALLNIIIFVVAMIIIPLVWPFTPLSPGLAD
jgi:di/tricarboxylate transporter